MADTGSMARCGCDGREQVNVESKMEILIELGNCTILLSSHLSFIHHTLGIKRPLYLHTGLPS